MEFASIGFLWAFLPTTLLLFFLTFLIRKEQIRLQTQNILLLVLSLFFYSFGGLKNLGFILCFCLVNYLVAIFESRGGHRKAWFTAGVIFDVLLLCLFKYEALVVSMLESFRAIETFSLSAVLKAFLRPERTYEYNILSFAMPLAMSFIVFQNIGYLADVRRGKAEAERNPFTYLLFNLLFVQLVQGPIVRYNDLGSQIKSRVWDKTHCVKGIRRFCFGLAKKVIIANTLAQSVDAIWASYASIGCGAAWIGALFYTLQIYYDFSGYTDMAIGLGGMLGFHIPENFDYPYTALSIQEFWRRWHMTLSTWFRDYVYIPLGGNRRGAKRTFVNLLIVFLLTGIWHGADLSFIIWGLLHGFFSILERGRFGRWLSNNRRKVINWGYMFLVVTVGWVFFRAPNMIAAGKYVWVMLGLKSGVTPVTSFVNLETVLAAILGLLGMGFIQRYVHNKRPEALAKTGTWFFADVFAVAVLVLSIFLIISGSFSPSIYGNF